MKKKRFVIVIIAALLLSILFLQYKAFGYIPVIGKIIANNRLSSYCNEKIEVNYNFPYSAEYNAKTSEGNSILYFLSTDTIVDEAFNKRIGSELYEKYILYTEKKNTESISYPEHIYVSARIDASDISKYYLKVYILTIYENVSLNDDESKRRMCEIAKDLADYLQCNITSLNLNYANKNGLYELSVDCGKKQIAYDRLSKYITRFDDYKLPADYIEWKTSK